MMAPHTVSSTVQYSRCIAVATTLHVLSMLLTAHLPALSTAYLTQPLILSDGTSTVTSNNNAGGWRYNPKPLFHMNAYQPEALGYVSVGSTQRSSTSRGGVGALRMTSSIASATVHEIEMPALSSTMQTGKVVKWLKQEGEYIREGDMLAVIESDKADMDVESFSSGYLLKQVAPLGSTVNVGEAIALLSSSMAADISTYENSKQAEATDEAVDISSTAAIESKRLTTAVDTPNSVETTSLLMPSLSSTMKAGKVVKWLKKIGDKIEIGDAILVVESDKADMEVESFESGYLGAIIAEEGMTVNVLEAVGLMVTKPEDVELLKKRSEVLLPDNTEGVKTGDHIATSTQSSDSPTSTSFPEFIPGTVDQDILQQIPPGYTTEQFINYFLKRLQTSAASNSLASLKNTPEGNQFLGEMMERAFLRVPSGNIMNAENPSRRGSLWQFSKYAKAMANELGVKEDSIEGTGVGGRILVEDVITAAATKTSNAVTPTPSSNEKTIHSVEPSGSLLAKEKGIDTKTITGTGPYNRVTLRDVKNHLGIPSTSEATSNEGAHARGTPVATVSSSPSIHKLKGMESAIAKNMEATINAPVFRVSMDIKTDKLDDIYQQLKPSGVTLSALLAKAVALTLEKHKRMNAAYSQDNGGSIIYPSNINIAMAVALEDGLITPVLKDANKKPIMELSTEWRSLITKAKENRLSADEYMSGTFVISNLGMYGVSQFDAILPKGVGTIMAIAASTPKVVETLSGEITTVNEMTVTVTSDHRHIYGSHAAEFLKDFKYLLENEIVKVFL